MKAFFKQNAFIRASVIVLAASLFALMATSCPNAAGGGSQDGKTPVPAYIVNFRVEGTPANGTLKAAVDGSGISTGAQVEEGKTVVFIVWPASGYRVKGWTLDGNPVNGTDGTYSLKVTKAVNVRVSFEPIPKHAITFSVDGGNGSLTAKGPNFDPITTGTEIEEGETVYFTAVPDSGFMTGSWTISGGSFEAGTGTPENPLANAKVSAPLTVRVSFKPELIIQPSQLNIQGTVLKGYIGEKPAGILNVPEDITEIADKAFEECTGITEVHLPEGLTKIGMYAFYACEGITKLTMGKNLTHIGYGAFNYCKNLEGRLEFPENLTEIGSSAFSQCSKVSGLDFSKCTKPLTIGEYAFEGCKMTGTVQLPASLASLGEGAFWTCNKAAIFDLQLCKNPPLRAIGTDTFYGTTGRFKVKTGSGVKELLTGSGVDAGKIDESL